MNALQQMLRIAGFPWGERAPAQALCHVQRPGEAPPLHADQVQALSRALAALQQENQRLKAESRAKTRLFAAAIHDLRQPLQALMLFSDALSDGAQPPERARAVTEVQHSIDSLGRLCVGLLDLAQIDAGHLRADCREIALAPLLDELRYSFRAVAKEQGLRFVVRPTCACVHGDAVMLTRILNNLVSNALRNTERGGVLVGVRTHRAGLRIDVCDTGIGIAPHHQVHVFDEFYKGCPTASIKHGREGLGLGLATARRLAQMQGACLALRSQPGRGTRVSLCFQAAPVAAAPQVTA